MGILNWVPALATQQLRGIPFGHRRPRGERYPHRTILRQAPRCMRSAGVGIGQLHEALDRHFTYFFDVRDPERGFQPVSAIADTILKLTRTHTDIVAFTKV